ncbi:hypothetical protein R1sor_002859 [Riccia sorocarpa]|uniref:Uncharacterized protein n=1 Tax=Riccia sorocarpa TaxID=122646 RepID=A0ABD3H2M6_9MARC
MDDSGPIVDSQDAVGLAASLCQPTGNPVPPQAQHNLCEFPFIPPPMAYPYGLPPSQMCAPPPSHQDLYAPDNIAKRNSMSPDSEDGEEDLDDTNAGLTGHKKKKEENVPLSLGSEWIELLDGFMGSRHSTQPPSVADSSGVMGDNTAIDDTAEPSSSKARMTGKRKHTIGENTKFLVQGITTGMCDSMEMLVACMKECEQMKVATEEKAQDHMERNVDNL